ncbi:MAG: hypothetical protein JNJ97_11125, partial [Alphaproteobacteria bacterium]|nr:hypothetical protein [Alphaproteobacteria bacterium]
MRCSATTWPRYEIASHQRDKAPFGLANSHSIRCIGDFYTLLGVIFQASPSMRIRVTDSYLCARSLAFPVQKLKIGETMQSATRILFLPKLRILSGELTGPDEPRALLQAAILVPLAPISCRFAVAGNEVALDADHALLVNPMTEHARLDAGPRSPMLVALLGAEWATSHLSGKRGVQASRPFPATLVPQTPSFRQRLDALLAQLRDPAATDMDLTAAAETYAQEALDTYAGPVEAS